MGRYRKVVLITGATSGIGFALAKCFRKEGYFLILTSSSRERLQQAAIELRKSIPGRKEGIAVICQDLSLPDAAEQLYARLKKKGIKVDILVNNAGIGMLGEAAENNLEKLHQMIQVNIKALTQLCTLFLHEMYREGSGKILNVASVGAFQPGPYTASYYASKAYVARYSRAIRHEAAGKGVQVCTLYPGTTRTDFFRRAGGETPFWAMPADKVARIAFAGLMKNREIIVPGMFNRLLLLVPVKIKLKAVAGIKRRTACTGLHGKHYVTAQFPIK